MKNCPNCGVELKYTSWGRYYCPNCGIIGQDEDANIPKGDDKQSYIG